MARPCLNDTGREQQLDLIKMISCIAVVGLHCLRSDPFWLCTLIYQLCAFAVPCFFMSSGYILLNRQSIDYRYAFRKIFGIVRVVVLWHILLYGVEFLVEVAREGFQLQKGMETAILCGKNIIRCLLQKGPIWQFWYLGALCLLYLCLPILQKLLRLKEGTSRGWAFWSVTVVVCVAIQGASMIAGRSIQEGVIQSFRLWTWLQYFVLGGLMPALVGRMKEKVTMGVHVVVLLVLTAASVASRWAQDQLLFHIGKVEYFYDAPLTIAWVMALFSFISRCHMAGWLRTVVRWSTPMIMGVYIVHVEVRALLISVVSQDTGGMLLILAVAVLSISAFVAFLLSKLPFGKYLIQI